MNTEHTKGGAACATGNKQQANHGFSQFSEVPHVNFNLDLWDIREL